MYDDPIGVVNGNKSSEILQEIKLMTSQNSTNNSNEKFERVLSYKQKEKSNKQHKSKKTTKDEFNEIINKYIEYHQNYINNIDTSDITKTPKKPLLIPKQNSKQLNINEENYLKNNFIKYNKNKNIKNYVAPSFDYNIKNNHKNNNIKLNLKNCNSVPIKLQNKELKILYNNKIKNKQNIFPNSSIDVKASSSSSKGNNSFVDKRKKSNDFSKKNSNKSYNNKINYNTNYNPEIRKYVSYTPGPVKKTSYINSNNISVSHDFEDKRRKEEIKMIFEREFNRKMNTKKNKKIKNSNTIILIPRLSRNSKIDDNDNLRNSQSHKDLNKNNLNKEEYQIVNYLGKNTHSKIDNNKSNFSYDKYYSVLQQKIKKLGEDISNLKNEEKSLSIQLINYNKKEKECNEVRKIREEIEKYKIIIEKSDKVCQEYTIEIQKIKNIIEDKDNNISEEQYININKSE